MIRWGCAIFLLGMLWPVKPPWAFWVGTTLCIIGGCMIGRAIGVRLRDRARR